MSTTQPSAPPAGHSAASGGRPRWYLTLFTTDMLERFGFYGMQAILVLYAAAPAESGGLGLSTSDAASLFGAWIALMFMLSLPGGWIGDRLLGQRRALIAGAATSMVGYLCLATPVNWMTAVGLIVLAVGGGLYKPNHQAMINMMFGASRKSEAGISLMYVGVQVSALLAPLVTGYLGERVNWHLGFSVAALVMLLTTILLLSTAAQFRGVGNQPGRPLNPEERRKVGQRTSAVLVLLAAIVLGMGLADMLSASMAIALSGVISVIVPVIGYTALYRNPGLTANDRRRLRGFLAVFLGATLFWMIIAHAASLLNLFARDHVDLNVFGFVIPASWLQTATPAFILIMAPVFAWLLPRIGRKHNVAVKFSLGLLLVGGSFLLMSAATLAASDGTRISPLWLIVVYLAHACGELIIAAVTIAAAGEVLPRAFMGRTLGLLWLFASLGGGLGAGVVRLVEVMPEHIYYLGLGTVASVVGLAFAFGRKALTRALARDEETESVPATAAAQPAPAAM
ncbi:MAG TPA: oligopeptide:H+ symporter [Pseudonocardiaceae bacterium]